MSHSFNSGPPLPFLLFFVLVACFIVFGIVSTIIGSVSESVANDRLPVQTDEATIVAKRTDVSGGKNSTSSTYYATFELPGGLRKEFEISGPDYGQFVEGDSGQLTHQGTRFHGFTRQPGKVESVSLANPPPANLLCQYCGGAIPQGTVKCASCGWTWRPSPSSQGERQQNSPA